MAWVKVRFTDDGTKRFIACYRDPEGRQRSAGTYSSHRGAERAGNREEAKVRDGSWHDHSRGQVTFAEYVQTVLAALQARGDLHSGRLPVQPGQALHPAVREAADGQNPAL